MVRALTLAASVAACLTVAEAFAFPTRVSKPTHHAETAQKNQASSASSIPTAFGVGGLGITGAFSPSGAGANTRLPLVPSAAGVGEVYRRGGFALHAIGEVDVSLYPVPPSVAFHDQ